MKKRPINLDLTTLKFPVTAIASILHRVSGVILFLLIPVLLCFLSCSLKSAEGFAWTQNFLSSFWVKLGVWLFLGALIYHLFAGVRHLIMDFGRGESLSAARNSARFVIFLTIISMIGLGFWLW